MRFLRLGALALLATVACSRTDTEVRVWRPSDHDQARDSPLPGQSIESAPVRGATASTATPDPQTTWDSLCSGCHGQLGLGDGPMGATVGAKNLTDPRWQASVRDDQIAYIISHGKGRMPAFSLKPDSVKALIGLIRKHVAKKD